jgi:hypothetical protein
MLPSESANKPRWPNTKMIAGRTSVAIALALSTACYLLHAKYPIAVHEHIESVALTSRRLSEDADALNADDEISDGLKEIISAKLNLISIEFLTDHSVNDDSYSGIIGVFCNLDFEKQKSDPNQVPMFRDLIDATSCSKKDNLFRVDLGRAVELARAYDIDVFRKSYNSFGDDDKEEPTILSLKGAIFHESRCGSTLAANALVALNPKKNRVYSESTPPKLVLKMCEEDFSKCSVEGAANLLRDVVYLMGRSDDPAEENLFFKFQSTTTRNMHVFRTAFPSTPWIFLYREPVEVMQSQLEFQTSSANCVRNYKNSPMIKLMARRMRVKLKNLQDEEICAIHLATICGAAIINLEDANGLGMALSYHKDMVTELLDYVFPIHFHTPVHTDGYKRVMDISKLYSKGGNEKDEIFESDKNEKRAKASSSVKDAAVEFLDPSYKKLEKSDFNFNKICDKDNLDARILSYYCRLSRRNRL